MATTDDTKNLPDFATTKKLPEFQGLPISARVFGIGSVLSYCLAATDDKKLKLVSVGSGTGRMEKIVEDHLEINITCVDPEPQSYCKGAIVRKPDYSLVADLIAAQPSIVGRCALLLYWPSPDKSTYDFEAVRDLAPVSICVVFEALGGAAGSLMHCWLERQKYASGVLAPRCSELKKTKTIKNKAKKIRHEYVGLRHTWAGYCTPGNVDGWTGEPLDRSMVVHYSMLLLGRTGEQFTLKNFDSLRNGYHYDPEYKQFWRRIALVDG
jgi:hypothetical protein